MLNRLRWWWYTFFQTLGVLCLRIGREVAGTRAMPDPLSQEPLSAEEVREIVDFLQCYNVRNGYLADIYSLDGFLTCVAIGPETIPAEGWMACIFMDDHALIPPDELDRQCCLIVRLHNMIVAQLGGSPPAYRPLFETAPGHEHARRPIHAWCQGFMTATVMLDDRWEEMLYQPESAMWLYPIWECASTDEKPRSKKRSPSPRGSRGPTGLNSAQLSNVVLKILAYWGE